MRHVALARKNLKSESRIMHNAYTTHFWAAAWGRQPRSLTVCLCGCIDPLLILVTTISMTALSSS